MRTFLVVLVVMLVVAAGLATALIYWEVSTTLPPVDQLAQYRPPVSTQILADDGSVIGEFYFEKRYLVPIDRIPMLIRNAFIAAEDDQFYTHKGVDPVSILRAFANNIVAGGKVQGGSTITQQVVKQLLLSPKKSYERKLKEVLLAIRLEQQLSKDDILSLYLNHIYLGSGAYGVAAAANEYFGKPIDKLSVAEAALLAGLPQAPSKYSPFKHWPRARARQHYVLERMAAVGFITPAEADLAMREPIALASRKGSFVAAQYYVEHVRRMLDERFGDSALYQLGLRVQTAVDLRLQTAAEAALRDGLREIEARQHYDGTLRHLEPGEIDAFIQEQRRLLHGRPLERGKTYEAIVRGTSGRGTARLQIGPFHGVLVADPAPTGHATHRNGDVLRVRVADGSATDPQGNANYTFERSGELALQGAAIVIDPRSGDIKAMVGGTDFDGSQFNRATQAARQPGSAFKPLVYAAAFDDKFTPASVIVDAPVSFPDNNGVWTPHNYENRFFGPTTLREALTFSRNVPTVKLAQQLGIKRLVTFIKSIGIHSPLPPNLSLALGSSEVTLLDLTAVYTAFANKGMHAEPRFITKITDSQGNLIDDIEPRLDPVLSPETAYIVTSILQDVIQRGTGRRAHEIGRPAAGKTGTTNDMNDAWFVGYTPQLLAGFWVGFDEKRTLGKGETGGRAVAPIWLRFMRRALEDEPILDFDVPSGISFVPVEPTTGHRTNPGMAGAILECFRRGMEPKVFVEPPVHVVSADGSETTPDGAKPVAPAAETFGSSAGDTNDNSADAGF
ncbi:MAG: PBP1A family penicillin-binding protein [Deltaproteobacteria bacterium]|nr:PBP1A family penicillin-binding protein [Deltaproteobacteria bacterium]